MDVPELVELDHWRLEHSLTQQSIADRLGISQAAFSQLLHTPGRWPKDSTLYRMRKVIVEERAKAARAKKPRRQKPAA